MEEKKNNGLVVSLIIFIVISIAACGYIAYDKFYKKEEKVINETVKKEEMESDNKEKNQYQPIVFDENKCIGDRCSDYNYNLANATSAFGITVSIENKKNVKIQFNSDKIKSMYGDSVNVSETAYNVDFSQTVQDLYIMGFGQAVGDECIFFLMEDGTIEYIHVYEALKNNSVKSFGKLAEVADVIKIVEADANPKNSPIGGHVTALALKANGEFFDLYSKVVKY